MYVDNASHIRAHGINGCMRSKSKVVDAQVGRTLVHHITDHVYFHLNMVNKSSKVRPLTHT